MVTDFHSHILPGIDDGSKSLEESIAMLKREAEQGVTRVVATPHFYAHHDSPERFLARRDRAENRLREEMEKHSGLPELHVGAEIYFFSGISDSDILKRLTIDLKGCILLEMPVSPWSDSMFREIADIPAKQGLTPIIAHVDRYIGPFRTHGIPERLEKLPVYVQANANFFLRTGTRSMALRMLKENRIHLLGSDCHNMSDRRPNLGAAADVIRKRLGVGALDRICSFESEILGM